MRDIERAKRDKSIPSKGAAARNTERVDVSGAAIAETCDKASTRTKTVANRRRFVSNRSALSLNARTLNSARRGCWRPCRSTGWSRSDRRSTRYRRRREDQARRRRALRANWPHLCQRSDAFVGRNNGEFPVVELNEYVFTRTNLYLNVLTTSGRTGVAVAIGSRHDRQSKELPGP